MVTALLVARLMHQRASLPDTQVGTPEGRYRRLRVNNPTLIRRLTQKEVAAWLGVNQVSLGRIIKRVHEEDLVERTSDAAGAPE